MNTEIQNVRIKQTLRLCAENAGRFAMNLLFVFAFQALFGVENTLLGVAIGVGFTMYPTMPLGLKPGTAAVIITFLFTACAAVSQTALLSPWAALPLNFLFVALILLLMGEPMNLKPSICFLLAFVFGQSTPVPPDHFLRRLAGGLLGGLFVSAAMLYVWHKVGLGHGADERGLKEQAAACKLHRGYILRMAAGISAAMFAAMILHLKKPLWISIVVMSLTQPEFKDTFERIKHRSIATLIGIPLFIILFDLLIPPRYAMAAILFIGYLSFFTPQYKYKQIVNAINAINASLVLLDTSTAIANRGFCLIGGILIVLFFWSVQLMWAHFATTPAQA